MNTVFFSIYDCGCRSSALFLRGDVDWGMINKYMYKEQIPDAVQHKVPFGVKRRCYEILEWGDRK